MAKVSDRMGGNASRTINPLSFKQRMRSVSFILFERLYGEEFWEYHQSRFRPVVREALASANGVVIDAACGAWNPYLHEIPVGETIGIDLDEAVRRRNQLHRKFLIQDLHDEIDLKDVGAIISVYTWEHLRAPQKVLANFHKVLRPGAPLVIVAPQRYYYISLLTLVLTKSMRDLAWRVATGRKSMPFPAYYQLCSRKSLANAAAATGFDLVEYRAHDVATGWFLQVPPIFLLACGWMWLVNRFDVFEPLRSSFVAVLRKNHPAASRQLGSA